MRDGSAARGKSATRTQHTSIAATTRAHFARMRMRILLTRNMRVQIA
jgi:hypothetical protein